MNSVETAAVKALIAEFIGAITGMQPPLEREVFPPCFEPALTRLCGELLQVARAAAAREAATAVQGRAQ